MILTIDIGGTSVKLALMDRSGRVVKSSEARYKAGIMESVIAEAREFLENCDAGPVGIGVSATGQIDTKTGTVIGTNGSIPGYEGTCIKKELETVFKVPVCVLNDANAAALGEYIYGAGQGCDNMLMVTLGTGIGGGLILNGNLYEGKRGLAGEIGHFTLYQDGQKCTCGKTGCFELYASTKALLKKTGTEDGRLFFQEVRRGSEPFRKALEEWLEDVAAGITGLVHIFAPELVLIGGGISAQKELVTDPLRDKILSSVMPRFAEDLSVKQASLGNKAGMFGALRFWLDKETFYQKNLN